MASIIPGYEYDIFISYRQKDNKYDGWVTDFVGNLKRELEATFKEEISVYFDINPHDGLLETHDVSDSLKEKLKCLIFIPIISRTYCDPKSFAWEYEFKPFIEQASQDQFGIKVKLPNGNVGSRVLPVRIHDLDNKDLLLCESVLGTYLRGVEFIYKEPGVNRPLKAHDNEKTNINKTIYRNQINRVANAVQEIISGLRSGETLPKTEKPQHGILVDKPPMVAAGVAKPLWQKIYSGVVMAVLIILAGIFVYQEVFQKDRMDFFIGKGEISVAVMPFQNLTHDASRNFWEVMIQDNLITSLSNVSELKIRQTESVLSLLDNNDLINYASLSPALARSVSQKLDANVFIHGSINQVGNVTRLNAKLIDSKTQEVFKSFQIDGSSENILNLSDSLSLIIRDYLIVEMLKKDFSPSFRSNFESATSPQVLFYFLEGQKSFGKRNFAAAREMYLKALEIDSNFVLAEVYLATSYGNQGMHQDAKKCILKVYEKRKNLTRKEKLMVEAVHSTYFGTPAETIKYWRQILEIDDQIPVVYYLIGLNYTLLGQYNKAIPEYEKALEIYDKWGIKPGWVFNYTLLGEAYHETGQFRKVQNLYKEAEKVFYDDPSFIQSRALLALARGKTKQADEYLEKYVSIIKDEGASEASIQTQLAYIYEKAGKIDKAVEHFRNALLSAPENPIGINTLAFRLIKHNLNITEGMDLAEKALELHPENHSFLHTKGLGLYKQGKFREALEVLQKSWDIRRELAVYHHEAFLHLEEAKKAVAKL
jgi:tetratricopeptide (TPR) repeat protein